MEFDLKSISTTVEENGWLLGGFIILASVLGAILWVLLAKHVEDHWLFPFYRIFRKQAFAEELISEIFEGKVELVTDKHLKTDLTEEQIKEQDRKSTRLN